MKLTTAQVKALKKMQTQSVGASSAVLELVRLGLAEALTGSGEPITLYRRTPAGIQETMNQTRIEAMLYTRDSSGRKVKRGWGKKK